MGQRCSYFFRVGEHVPLLFMELMTKYLLYHNAFVMRSRLFVSIFLTSGLQRVFQHILTFFQYRYRYSELIVSQLVIHTAVQNNAFYLMQNCASD